MKKLKIFAIAVLLIVTLICAAGCDKKISYPENIKSNSDNILSWDSVRDARSYSIEITNKDTGEVIEKTAKKTNYSLSSLSEGDYEIKVKSVAGNENQDDSDWSTPLDFHRDYESGCIYNLIKNNTEYEVSKVGSAKGVVKINPTYRGKPVTSIADGAFKGSGRITGIEIYGDNLTTIGYNAFYNCTQLEYINLPESLVSLGTSAFQGCRSLKDVTLPSKINIVDEYVFGFCTTLKSVEFKGVMEKFADYAFINCSSLESIEIPDTVTSIGKYTFSGNRSLTSITIGKGVKSIGGDAFFDCQKLHTVEFSNEGNLVELGSEVFANCYSLAEISIPDGVTSIGYKAFYGCSVLDKVTLPQSITHIGEYAFSLSKYIADAEAVGADMVYVGDWLVDVLEENFAPIEGKITADYFKSGLVGIADAVFYRNSILTEIYIPNSVKYIGRFAFSEATNLWKIAIEDKVKANLEVIDEFAFAQCARITTNYEFGPKLKIIGKGAFQGTSIESKPNAIPDTVESIGVYAFQGTHVTNNPDKEGISYFGNWIVGCDNSLTRVTISDNTIGIADYAFYKCDKLINITGTSTNKLRQIGFAAFYACKMLTQITIGDNVRVLDDYTFYGCEALFAVSLPSRLQSIGRAAFYKCTALNDMDLSSLNTLNYIGLNAFYGCEGLKSITLSDSLKEISGYAFYKCLALESLVLPDSVEVIGERAFYGNTAIATLDLGNAVSLGNYAFAKCEGLQSIEIPSSMETVGDYAFYKCAGVTSLKINEGVKAIGNYSFYELPNITGIVFPTSLETIGNYAFKGCKRIDAIVIGSSIQQIGAHAFYGCKEITFYTDAEESQADSWGLRWNSAFRPVVWESNLDDTNSYVVSFTIKEGTISNPNAVYGICGPTRDGYDFVGWATTQDGEAVYLADEIVEATVGEVLYSVWTEAEEVEEQSPEQQPEQPTES